MNAVVVVVGVVGHISKQSCFGKRERSLWVAGEDAQVYIAFSKVLMSFHDGCWTLQPVPYCFWLLIASFAHW